MSARLALIASLALLTVAAACAPDPADAPADTPDPEASRDAPRSDEWLEVALEAAAWIDASSIEVSDGLTWPADPARPGSVVSDLYSGTPGVVLFYFELERASGQARWGDRGRSGASALAASLPEAGEEVEWWGLYTGLAGRCVALMRAARSTGDPALHRAAMRCLDLVIAGSGAPERWGAVTDVIGGAAGIGAFLLAAAADFDRPDALAAARAAGDQLLAAAIEDPAGLKWAMAPGYPRMMPNFSHGTAGIVYFLARLYGATGQRAYLDAALAGGRYLRSIADTEGDVCLIYHHEPEGTELYYLSWCHGPAGTGRTFFALWQATADTEWLDWTHRSAAAILASGIPESRTPGFWNNVSLCCGNGGVAEFFLDLYVVSGRKRYLEFARQVVGDLVDRATRDDRGARWLQAEHRVRPDDLVAQTGWMQGASGIGTVLLQLRAVESGRVPPAPLPDNPFRR